MRSRERLAWRVAQGLCLVLAVLGAGVYFGSDGTTAGTVGYSVAWDTAGVEVLDGGGWRATTADGHVVEVQAGTLTVRVATMVACPHRHGVVARLQSWFAALPASAGHNGVLDPVELEAPTALDLATLDGAALGEVTTGTGEPSYCQAQLVAAGGSAAEQLAGEAAPTLDVTATVDGTPVEVDAGFAWGWKVDLPSAGVLDRSRRLTVAFTLSATALAAAIASSADAAGVLRALAPEASASTP